jgi:AhpD family alkylhydroperoxidase
MMLDWNQYQKQIQQQIAEIGRSNRDVLKGYRVLSNAGDTTNLLGGKTRELIAIAVAVTRQCDGCIVTHVDAAIKQGASKEEIIEALSVAIAVNTGATLIFSSRVMDAFSSKMEQQTNSIK